MTSAPARSWVVLGRLILSLSPRAPGALEPASASPPTHLPFDPHSPLLGQILLPQALSPASLVSWLSAHWVQRLHVFTAPGRTSGCEGRGCCVAHFLRKGTRASITHGWVSRPPSPTAPSVSQPCSGCRIWYWQPSKAPDYGFGLQLPGQEGGSSQEVLSLPSDLKAPLI